MRVALVHDWLTGMRGGERVLEVLCELYPKAPIYTLFFQPNKISHTILNHKIHSSFLNKFPFVSRYYRYLLPLFPYAIESFNLTQYDLVISTSHCVAKGVITGVESVHISYTHTPMRYVWDMFPHYFQNYGFIRKFLVKDFSHNLRIWDVTASARVDHFIANSNFVKKRINKFYRRESEVLHPPVDVQRFNISHAGGNYYLVLSAFVPYKKVDIAIKAFKKRKDRLVVAGNGPLLKQLKRMSSRNVQFSVNPNDVEVVRLIKNCKALIFPGVEDLGIVPLEAMACGKPVIAYCKGGVTETVKENITGLFFYEQSATSLNSAIEKFEQTKGIFDENKIRFHAEQFSIEKFKVDLKQSIDNKVNSRIK